METIIRRFTFPCRRKLEPPERCPACELLETRKTYRVWSRMWRATKKTGESPEAGDAGVTIEVSQDVLDYEIIEALVDVRYPKEDFPVKNVKINGDRNGTLYLYAGGQPLCQLQRVL